MNRPRLIKGLKISWAAFWSVVAVLLIVLWVRSYWWMYSYGGDHGNRFTSVAIASGSIGFMHTSVLLGYPPLFASFPVPDNLEEDDIDSFIATDTECRAFGFYLNWFRAGVDVNVPCWFATLICAAFSVMPWLRFRFTLRTLLIITTLVALALGLIVWAR